jgi:hypothetical protein
VQRARSLWSCADDLRPADFVATRGQRQGWASGGAHKAVFPTTTPGLSADRASISPSLSPHPATMNASSSVRRVFAVVAPPAAFAIALRSPPPIP